LIKTTRRRVQFCYQKKFTNPEKPPLISLVQGHLNSCAQLGTQERKIQIEYIDSETFPYSQYFDIEKDYSLMHRVFVLSKGDTSLQWEQLINSEPVKQEN